MFNKLGDNGVVLSLFRDKGESSLGYFCFASITLCHALTVGNPRRKVSASRRQHPTLLDAVDISADIRHMSAARFTAHRKVLSVADMFTRPMEQR